MNVSVVIPTCNRPKLLKEALSSVFEQTYKNFEIVIVDDGEDSPEQVLKEFDTSRITYIKNKEKQGGAGSRNIGVENSKYDPIAFLDDDDTWVPEKLEKQINALIENKEAQFCFCAVLNIFPDKEERTYVPQGLKDVHELALRRFKGFLTSGLVVHKKAFKEIGGFDSSFPSHQEAELMIRLSKNHLGFGIDEPLVRMNLAHGGEHIGGNINRRIEGREKLLEKHKETFLQHSEIHALQQYRFFFLYRSAKQYKEAKRALLKAWKIHSKPLYLLRYIAFIVLRR